MKRARCRAIILILRGKRIYWGKATVDDEKSLEKLLLKTHRIVLALSEPNINFRNRFVRLKQGHRQWVSNKVEQKTLEAALWHRLHSDASPIHPQWSSFLHVFINFNRFSPYKISSDEINFVLKNGLNDDKFYYYLKGKYGKLRALSTSWWWGMHLQLISLSSGMLYYLYQANKNNTLMHDMTILDVDKPQEDIKLLEEITENILKEEELENFIDMKT